MIIATEFYMPNSEARLDEIVEAISRNDDVAEKLLLYINSNEQESVSFAKKYLNFKNVYQISLTNQDVNLLYVAELDHIANLQFF